MFLHVAHRHAHVETYHASHVHVAPRVHVEPPQSATTTTKPNAQVVSSHIAPVFSAPKLKDDYIAIKVNPTAYEKCLKLCSHLFISQVFLSKREEPWKLLALREKLQSICKLSLPWRLISLGRGFYYILLHSEEEKSRIWGIGALFFNPQILRLQPWVQNFNLYTQRITNAQICVQFYNLPWEYWDHQIFSDLTRCVGVPFESTPKRGWISVMLILRSKCRNATINNKNDAQGQLKLRSEAWFPIKGFKTSPLYFSKQWVEMLN